MLSDNTNIRDKTIKIATRYSQACTKNFFIPNIRKQYIKAQIKVLFNHKFISKTINNSDRHKSITKTVSELKKKTVLLCNSIPIAIG